MAFIPKPSSIIRHKGTLNLVLWAGYQGVPKSHNSILAPRLGIRNALTETKQHSFDAVSSIASLDRVLHGVVARLPHLGLEVQVHQLSLLRRPLPVRVAVEDNLVTPRVPHLSRRVRERAIGAPFQLVARRLGHQERRAASLVAVAIQALLHGVVEDLA